MPEKEKKRELAKAQPNNNVMEKGCQKAKTRNHRDLSTEAKTLQRHGNEVINSSHNMKHVGNHS